jgi:hypothetical protein
MPRIHQLAIPACAILTLCAAVAYADQPSPQRVAAEPEAKCVTSESRIPHHCSASPSRSFSAQDMKLTGASNPAGALRLLDPDMTRP